MSGLGISGIGSGVDWGQYVDAIIKAEQKAIANTLGRREVISTAQKTVFANAKGTIDALAGAIRNFKFSGDFKVKSITSSNSDFITGTASLSASKQTLKVEIEKLAQSEVQRYTFASLTDSVTNADTNISVTVRGTVTSIAIPAGTTFEGLRDKINAARIGVTASAFNSGDGTGEPSRLTITDNKVGDQDNVDTTANVTFDFSTLLGTLATQDNDTNPVTATHFIRKAQNAYVRINGDLVVRDTNSISDVVPGVTLNLLQAQDGTEFTINVVESTKDAAAKVKDLVDKYNDVLKMLKAAIVYDPQARQQSNPTAGDSTLRNVLSRLQTGFMQPLTTLPSSNESVRSLSDLGVVSSLNTSDPSSNGVLSFDPNKFNAALNANYDKVVQFFEGLDADGTQYKGWADTLDGLMKSFTGGVTGAVTGKIASLDSDLKRITDDKVTKLERLVAKEERLRAKFARLEGQMAALQQQQSTLTQSIQALNLNSQAIANRK